MELIQNIEKFYNTNCQKWSCASGQIKIQSNLIHLGKCPIFNPTLSIRMFKNNTCKFELDILVLMYIRICCDSAYSSSTAVKGFIWDQNETVMMKNTSHFYKKKIIEGLARPYFIGEPQFLNAFTQKAFLNYSSCQNICNPELHISFCHWREKPLWFIFCCMSNLAKSA